MTEDGWDQFLEHCPSWKCDRCGYYNGGLVEVCWGKKGCKGKRPSATEAGVKP